ncbi:MAG: succinate dehydrogenase cytochrome b subunit [Bacteroidota bacterium]
MSSFLGSSIGKKLIMSLSGLFLVTFLLIHLTLNMTLFWGAETYNAAAGFMGSNVIMKILEPVLGIGFLIHILYSLILYFKNLKARPVKYAVFNQKDASSWSSRNMLLLGIAVASFLVVHLINYFYKVKFTDLIDSGETTEYDLVINLFTLQYWYFVAIYLIGIIALGLHLNHSFQSAFQTMGINNKYWARRWKIIGSIYSLIVTVGFCVIPLYFLLNELI